MLQCRQEAYPKAGCDVGTKKLITAEELLAMPRDDYRYELVRGVLTEPLPPHVDSHGKASARFAAALFNYSDGIDFGLVTGRGGFQLETNRDTVRAPDIGWVAPGHPAQFTDGYAKSAPELAVEIKSPDETIADMDERASMWLHFGTQVVWVGDPEQTTVTRYRPGQSPEVLGEDDVLDGGELLPGFSIEVWRLFRRHR